jgi:hypothetical protein
MLNINDKANLSKIKFLINLVVFILSTVIGLIAVEYPAFSDTYYNSTSAKFVLSPQIVVDNNFQSLFFYQIQGYKEHQIRADQLVEQLISFEKTYEQGPKGFIHGKYQDLVLRILQFEQKSASPKGALVLSPLLYIYQDILVNGRSKRTDAALDRVHQSIEKIVRRKIAKYYLSAAQQEKDEIRKNLLSDNWVIARDAAKSIANGKIYGLEPVLVDLLKTDKIGLLSELVHTLTFLKITDHVEEYIELFEKINSQEEEIRHKDISIELLKLLGISKDKRAKKLLQSVLADTRRNLMIRKAAARNLVFYEDRQNIDFLISLLSNDMSLVQEAILVTLGHIGEVSDLESIKSVSSKVSIDPGRTDFDITLEREGFGDNKAANRFAFLMGLSERILNRSSEKVLVLGSVHLSVDLDKYEEAYQQLRRKKAENPELGSRNKPQWKNPEIISRIISGRDATELTKRSSSYLSGEHPEVQIIENALRKYAIGFYRGENGLLMEQSDGRLAYWSKDGSVLIPGFNVKDHIPFSLNSGNYPVRGETAIISGDEPILIVSEAAQATLNGLKEKFPELDIITIPHGFVTLRLNSGKELLIETSHIDCVFDIIPASMTDDNRPVVMIDPRYYKELMMHEKGRSLIDYLKQRIKAKVFVIPEEEAYLNPANFILLPDNRIILNKARKTRSDLILKYKVKDNSILMLDNEVTTLAALKGMIGCLGGIYTKERVLTANSEYKKPIKGEEQIKKRAQINIMSSI